MTVRHGHVAQTTKKKPEIFLSEVSSPPNLHVRCSICSSSFDKIESLWSLDSDQYPSKFYADAMDVGRKCEGNAEG